MTTHHRDDDEPPTLYALPPHPDDDGYDTRTPPHDLPAEMAALGGALLDPHAREDVLETLTGPDFYRPAHEAVFDAISHLHDAGEPVDAVTVAGHLIGTGQLAKVGGTPYLHDLLTAVPTAANAGYYARIVADQALLRRIVEAGTRVVQLGYAGRGGNVDDIAQAAQHTIDRAITHHTAGTPTTWAPVNLDYVLTGDTPPTPRAELLTRRDGKALLYAGAVHTISGEPGCGKTWVADIALAQQLEAGNPCLYLDFEDRHTTKVARLLELGVPPVQIAEHLRYVRPDVALSAATTRDLQQAADGVTLAVIDGVTEAMTMQGLSLMDNEDVAKFMALIPRRLADNGAAVLQIDHVVKNPENRGRYAMGAQHKLASLDGCAFKMVAAHAFGKGMHGVGRLTIDKDRHGDVGPNGMTVADVHLDATHPTGSVFGWLDNPTETTGADGVWRPTGLMEKVSRFLEGNAGASKKAIEDVVTGKRDHVRTALAVLINDGHVRTEAGSRGALHHYVDEPYRETGGDPA
jgi:hypothetical protein